MIVKIESVDGHQLAKLLEYIHSDENRVDIPHYGSPMIVQLKSLTPKLTSETSFYDLTLEVLESVTNGNKRGRVRVESEYLSKVYRIVHARDPKQVDENLAWDIIVRLLSETILGKKSESDIRIRTGGIFIPADKVITKTMINQLVDYLGELDLADLKKDEVVNALLEIQSRFEKKP